MTLYTHTYLFNEGNKQAKIVQLTAGKCLTREGKYPKKLPHLLLLSFLSAPSTHSLFHDL
jgi:hypothetical protein